MFVGLWVALKTLGSDYPWIEAPAWALLYGVAAFVVFRFGFVPLAVGLFVTDMLLNVPVTVDFSSWYATGSLLPLLSVVALAVWGFYNALAGPTFSFGTAYQLFHVGHFFRYARREYFGTIVGDQNCVFHAEVHVLVEELDNRFDGDHLASLHRSCR